MSYRLLARVGGRELRHPLHPGEHVLGAASDCDFVLPDVTVSRRHAQLRVGDDGTLRLRDVGSRNGCWLDGRRIEAEVALQPGLSLRLGDVELQLESIAEGDEETALAGIPAPATVRAPAPAAVTMATAPRLRFCGTALPRLLQLAAQGNAWTRIAAAALQELLDCGVLGTRLEQDDAILVEVGERSGDAACIERDSLRLLLHAGSEGAASLLPLGDLVLDLLQLAQRPHRVARGTHNDRPTAAAAATQSSRHPAMRELYRQAQIIAPSRLSVLIQGESGTGKELFARHLHQQAGLAAELFVALNCAALPRDLLDAELFGIEAGVATGVGARPGKFELAHGGTLFLDEIADMAPDTQARLLRVLQEGEVYRIGAKRARPAQVRVISACNRSLESMVAEGGFRLDLYHRIADWSASLPPLRERGEDIGLLAAQFLERECAARGIGYAGISRAALECLNGYAWPGNVRELEREMMRVALFLNSGEHVDSSLLKPALRGARLELGAECGLQGQLEGHERRIIEQTLRACDGQVLRAAERLGIGKSTLYRRIEALGVNQP